MKQDPWYIDIRYWPIRAWYRITNAYDEVRWAIQRARRGYDDTTRWGLYCTVTDISLPVLVWMKENARGYPAQLNSMEEWQEILGKMITAFEIIKRDDWEEQDKRQKELQEGLDLFAKYFRNLWD